LTAAEIAASLKKCGVLISEYYAYEEHKPVTYNAAYLQEYFEALVPFGYENDCGGFGDVILDVGA
jgi:hypothetical protein